MRVRPFLWSLALLAACLGPAGAQAAPNSNYGKTVSQTYDKNQQVTETHLANGLTILTKEVHAAPVVYNSVWYKVGSRNETSGRTGLSHILEHMMFKGTHDLPPGAIDHLFQSNGGQINASTGEDRTEYHELVAADRLELAVRVEADRMENSLFDPTELKHEMTVVRSELEGDSNDPGFQLYSFAFLPAAFTAHPYHWPTIGWTSDVEAVANNRNVIYQYYKDHYMPNNAVVVMVGDFDTKKAVALCQKYYGVYPAGKLAAHHITSEPPQRGERRVVLRRPGTIGEVLIGYHEPGTGTKAHYVMDVISQILSGGRSARLYQSMVETGIVESASAGDGDHKDPYLFVMDASVRSGVTNEAAEKALEGEISKLQDTPVTADELARAVRQIEAAFVFQNDSVSEQAGQLGDYAVIKSYKYLDTYLAQIHQVTAADIQRVAKQYFTPEDRTVALFEPQPLPPGQSLPPPPGEKNFGAAAPVTDPHQKAILAALDKKFNTGTKTTAQTDRPKPTRTVLPNGMTLIVEENHANHTVALTGLTRAGSAFDPNGKWGVAGMTAAMLPRGTTSKNSLQLALTLESVGAGIGISADDEAANFSGQCLAKDFGLTLSTLADELRHPAFPADQLEKLRGETLSGLENARQDTGGTGGAGTLADIAFSDALYPKGHPFWSPSLDQSEAVVKGLTRDDLQQFYDTYYRPDTTTLVVVGDVKTAAVQSAIKAAFGDWAKPTTPAPALHIADVPLPAQAPPSQLLSLPGTSQTSILWGYPGQLKRDSPDFYAATIMNYILGGGVFSSRLGKYIRDQSGLAYTVYSDFDASHGAGPFEVFIGTNPHNAQRALAELRTVTAQMRKTGVTPDEVQQAKAYLTGSYPLRLETNDGVAGQLLVSQDYGLGLDYIQKRAGLYNAVTVAQVNAAVQKYLHPEKATLIIAGATPEK
ncbi:MAG: insulinase family protein [Armatimonadota bacterium]|nr:insulinase family protein [Armatimonadota bacterium]